MDKLVKSFPFHGKDREFESRRDTGYAVAEGRLVVTLPDGSQTGLARPVQFSGYRMRDGGLALVLLANHGQHIEIHFDRRHPVGQQSPSGPKDVVLEAAVTTIQDCEDSVRGGRGG